MINQLDNLIWKYTEGKTTSAEAAQLEKLILSDQSIADQIEHARLIHSSLKNIKLEAAPDSISINVLQNIKNHHGISSEGIGITPLLAFFASAVILTVAAIFSTDALSPDFSRTFDQFIAPLITNIKLLIIGNYTSYILLGLMSLPLFYFIDKLIQTKKIYGLKLRSL